MAENKTKENKVAIKKITVIDYIDTMTCSKMKRDLLKRQYNYHTGLKSIKDWNKIIN